MQLSVLDCNHRPSFETTEFQLLAKEFCDVLSQQGFLYLKSNPHQVQLIAEMKSLSKEFFELSDLEKSSIAMKNAGRAWRGYFPLGQELTAGTADQKEGMYFARNHPLTHIGVKNGWPMHGQNQVHDSELGRKLNAVVDKYCLEMENLCFYLMSMVAVGLSLSQDYFTNRFGSEPTTLFRIFNYPANTVNSHRWGVGEHTDMGFLTVLLQDSIEGLQAQALNGEWHNVPPLEDTFVINIGDMLEYWTGGYLRATRHRVKNKNHLDRRSFPYFFDPGWKQKLNPIDSEAAKKWPKSQNRVLGERWDGLDLLKIPKDTEYGEFVWSKIRTVFPHLSK